MSCSVFTVFVIDFDGTGDKFNHVAIIPDQRLEVRLGYVIQFQHILTEVL